MMKPLYLFSFLFLSVFNLFAQQKSDTFYFTGSKQSFIVPATADTITIELNGAQGGANAMSVAGGLGGRATGKYKVNTGDTLYIYVGGQNGYNGGGNPGSSPCTFAIGGNGGGASDIRLDSLNLNTRIAVAGGGGGAGGDRIATCGRGTGGGGGGGYYGGGGGAGWPYTSAVVPTGGTQSAGGSAGQSDWTSTPNNDGHPGSFGIGGNGGDEESSNQSSSYTGANGGAGGGLTGSNGIYADLWTGQSGAGGSSFIASLIDSSTTTGVNSGNGFIVIKYDTACNLITISQDPNNDTLCSGNHAMFHIADTGMVIGYQWQRNTGGGWFNMGGQTNDTLIELNVTTTMNGYAYRCIVIGNCDNDTSSIANIVVYANPNITGITSSLNPSYNGYAPMQCSNLTATTTGGTGSYTYTWSPAGTGNPLNVCPTSGTWYTATVTDANGCQDTMSIKQYVIDASSTYPGRVNMCVKNTRTNRYSTLPVLLSSVPYYLNLSGAGNTLGACGAVPSKQGDAGYDDFADWYRIFPNPFANELNIEFMQMFEEDVRLSLTDLTGRVLKVIYHGKLYEGELVQFSLDASDLNTGMYLIRYESDTDMRVNKVQLVR